MQCGVLGWVGVSMATWLTYSLYIASRYPTYMYMYMYIDKLTCCTFVHVLQGVPDYECIGC